MTRQIKHTGLRSLWLALLAGVLGLATAAATLAPASAKAPVPRTFWGVAPQTSLGDADFTLMGQGQVGTLRIAVFWSELDPTEAPDDTSWASIDPIVAGAARNGVEVLPFLFGTPRWVAKTLDRRHCSAAKCGFFPPQSTKALAAWQAFVGEFVARYGSTGTFWDENPTIPKLPIEAVQAWNEQNSKSFFAPKPKPSGYAKLIAATAEAVRATDPSVQIVLGGMAQLAGSRKAIEASKYLEDLYKVPGVEDNFDGVAIHPYGATIGKVAAQVELFRKEMNAAHDKDAGLWVTEIGWGSDKGGNPLNRGLPGQAERLKQAFSYFRKNRNKLNIESVQWFSWIDNPVSICDWCASSGLFKANLKPKPSWKAFTKFTGGS
jgi:hypothetical protein